MSALKDNLLKYGILKCRDLVDLFYGARIVAVIEEFAPSYGPFDKVLLFGQDTRRVSYELILANSDPGPVSVQIGTPASFAPGTSQIYLVPPGDTVTIERNFFTDLDAVTQPVMFSTNNANLVITGRAVILTPAPVDEVPLG